MVVPPPKRELDTQRARTGILRARDKLFMLVVSRNTNIHNDQVPLWLKNKSATHSTEERCLRTASVSFNDVMCKTTSCRTTCRPIVLARNRDTREKTMRKRRSDNMLNMYPVAPYFAIRRKARRRCLDAPPFCSSTWNCWATRRVSRRGLELEDIIKLNLSDAHGSPCERRTLS